MALIDVSTYDIVKILKTLFSSMTPTVVICTSEEIDANNFKLTCSDTSYLRTGSVFIHNENTYTVTSFKVNEELLIEGTPRITDELITLRNPFFITDTPQGANNELNLEKTNLELHPFVWLLENFPTNYQDATNQYIGQSRVKLFFLDVSENNYWLNEDHRKECIEPMRNLINQFLVDLQYKVSGEINLSASNLSLTDRVRFGVYTGDKGNTKSIFNDQLSGVEVDINIPVKKYAADDCASLALIPSPIIQHTCQGTGGGGGGTTFFTDEFILIDRASGDQLIFNAEGQVGNVTLYSFTSGAIMVENEGPNFQNVSAGQVFSFIPNFAETYQVIANNNPTSFALINAPTGVTIDNNGLISWDGLGSATPPVSVTIQATNQFLTNSINVSVAVSTDFAGSPTTVVQTTKLNGYNDGDPLSSWADVSGNGYDLTQNTAADQPTVTFNGFNVGVPSILFDGITDSINSTAFATDLFPSISGEVWVVLKYSAIPSVNQCVWTCHQDGASNPWKELRYDIQVPGFIAYQYQGTGSDFATFAPYPVVIGQPLIIRVYWNASEMGVQFDKNTPPVTDTGSLQTTSGTMYFRLGEGIYPAQTLQGEIGCVAIYNGNLSAAEVNDNFDYINSIWG